jgi:hypothetical protein
MVELVEAWQVLCLTKQLFELGNTVSLHLSPLEQFLAVLEPVEQH